MTCSSPDGRILRLLQTGHKRFVGAGEGTTHLCRSAHIIASVAPHTRHPTGFYRSDDGHLVVVPFKDSGGSMTTGEPRSLMPLVEPPAELIHPCDIASDGRILALTPLEGTSSRVSLGVLMNWRPDAATK